MSTQTQRSARNGQLATITIVAREGKLSGMVAWRDESLTANERANVARGAEYILRKTVPEYGRAMHEMENAALAGFSLPRRIRLWLSRRALLKGERAFK